MKSRQCSILLPNMIQVSKEKIGRVANLRQHSVPKLAHMTIELVILKKAEIHFSGKTDAI